MPNKEKIYALDLGTTKFCIGILENDRSTLKSTVVESPSGGFKKGILVDFNEAQKSLTDLIVTTEEKHNIDIRSVVVGIAGSHLKSNIVECEIPLSEDPISETTLEKLSEIATDKNRMEHREILHSIPISFCVDNREDSASPIGLSGRTLKSRHFILDADKNYLKDVIRLCNQCGLQVKQLYAESYASAVTVADQSLKDLGVVIADIGGGTTDGVVFQNGKPVDIFTINTAGNHVHHDLSIGLNIHLKEAINYKERYGLTPSVTTFNYNDVHGKKISFSKSQAQRILESRVLELGSLMFHKLHQFQGNLGGGIIFTGGGSQLSGLDDFLSQKFGVSVTHKEPSLTSFNNELECPSHATVLGLLELEYRRKMKFKNNSSTPWYKKHLFSFYRWMLELSQ